MRVGAFILAAQFPGQGQGEALHRAVRSAEIAEEAGLDDVWLAEHHFVPYGVCPNAVTLAALLLGRTRRIGVGTAVSVLPTQHPVALGEQAALLHLTSDGRFTLGVGRGGPWVDLEVFGSGSRRVRPRLPRIARSAAALAARAPGRRGRRALSRSVRSRSYRVRPRRWPARTVRRPRTPGPPVVVACTSPSSVRLAAERGLPMLLGMHCGDEEKAEMVALWRSAALEAGRDGDEVAAAEHVSAGVVQIADGPRGRGGDAGEVDARLAPAGAGRACDRRRPLSRDA